MFLWAAGLNQVGNAVNLMKMQDDFSSFMTVAEAATGGTETAREDPAQDVK